ncbi:hypothetical protein M3225_26620 [Priestia aryabhattai]|uniref:hypothetical protein n=1 Tax=Priestia aryabhattai TaxID=412384 RepID=UPI002041A737|nr:hypothetical protein [Priestia aryabhattai]MCM3773993.1 hypothetical protein [Priestia aryabhattai]
MKKGLKALFVLGTIFISFIVIMSAMFSGSDDTKASETTAVSDTSSYRTEIASQSAQMTDIFTTLSTQMSNYSNTTEWKVDTAVAIQELRDLVDQANSIKNVPAEYKEVHEKYMQAMEQYEIVADQLPTAIDNLDANQINILSANMLQGNEYLTQATQEMKNVK